MVKLVDILARELKVWPDMPEGGTRLEQDINNAVIEGDGFGTVDLFMLSERADDQRGAHVDRAQWQAAVDALNAGEGMPPIGSHVVVVDDGTLMYGQGESGEVLAHVDGTAVIRMSSGLGCFLPRCLRTKEQIKAEEREKAIAEMTYRNDHAPLKDWAAYVYDILGYRKFEITDDSDPA